MTAYYNEFDEAAAHVLEQQIADGVIAPGVVDRRSIRDVMPGDLDGFTQCHFFAGGGLWSVAARMAGWPDNKPLWSGSCPCQAESLAGKRLGAADPRDLWPDFRRLIRARRPPVVVGEQVAAAAGTHWLDRTLSDLDDDLYAARSVRIPACAVDAPHERSRIYWLAVANNVANGDERLAFGQVETQQRGNVRNERAPALAHDAGGRWGDFVQPDADRGGRAGRSEGAQRRSIFGASAERAAGGLRCSFDVADAESWGDNRSGEPNRILQLPVEPDVSYWSDYEWVVSPLDGKARRAKPGISFLVDGLPGRVDLWRIGGNAIVPQVAAEVLASYLETEGL